MAEIVSLGNGVYRIVDGTRSRTAYAAGSDTERWVFLDGRVYVVDRDGSPEGLPPDPGEASADTGSGRGLRNPAARAPRKRRGGDQMALAAPMPATVVTITVEPGQRVSTGDVLILLEAMKMELPIKAPRAGVVKAIACRPGELVQPGVPLLELE